MTVSEVIKAFNTLYKVSHSIYKKSISECEFFETDNLDSSLDFYKGSIAGGLCILQYLNIYSVDEVKEIYSALVFESEDAVKAIKHQWWEDLEKGAGLYGR